LQLPAIASADIFLAQDTRGLPVEEFKREIFVGKAGAADFLTELSRRKFFRSGIGDEIDAGAVFGRDATAKPRQD